MVISFYFTPSKSIYPPSPSLLLQHRLQRFQHGPRALEVNALLLPPPSILCPGHLLPYLPDHTPRPPILRPGFAAQEEVNRHVLQAGGHHFHRYLLFVLDPLWICQTIDHIWPHDATWKITMRTRHPAKARMYNPLVTLVSWNFRFRI